MNVVNQSTTRSAVPMNVVNQSATRSAVPMNASESIHDAQRRADERQ
jgi:hypothetical protein